MKQPILIILFLLILLPGKAHAQGEYGTWTSIAVDKDFGKKWTIGAETELRTIYYLRLISRWSIGIDAEYKIIKPLEIGLSYKLMNTLDQKYLNYQLRNRVNANLTGKQKWGNFDFALSEGLQVTTKDDSKRLDEFNNIDTYKINPAWMWKNSLRIQYDIPKSKFTPGFEFETYHELNNPDGNQFDKLRYSLFVKYKYRKQHTFKLGGVYNQELGTDVADYSGKYILDLKYSYTFK